MSRSKLLMPLFIWAVCLYLAIFAGRLALGNSAEVWVGEETPGFWPLNALAASDQLEESVGRFSTQSLNFPDLSAPGFGAVAAYVVQQEPTDFAALRTLAINRSSTDDNTPTAARMRLIDDIYKRDRAVNLWLVRHELEQSNLDIALSQLDQLLRVLGDRRGTLLAFLSQILVDDAARRPMLRLLERGPVWEREFWYAISRNPQSVRMGLLMRRDLAAAKRGESDLDLQLLTRGFEQGLLAEASELYKAISGNDRLDKVRNSDFTQQPEYPPFDWQVLESEGFSGSIDPVTGIVDIYAAPSTKGAAIRQILRVSEGRYRAELKLTNSISDAAARPYVALRCVETQAPIPSAEISSAADRIVSEHAVPACQFIELAVEIPYTPTAKSYVLDSVSLEPA